MARVVLLALVAVWSGAQPTTVGTIDFYGLRTITESQARAALGLAEGDSVPDELGGAERRIAELPGAVSAHIEAVCCTDGQLMLYVGVQETGATPLVFRDPPKGTVRLPDDVVKAGAEFEDALMAAVERGDTEEDYSTGHALMHDPVSRAIQERFVDQAARLGTELAKVLRESADADQRALAAQVLAYSPDKPKVVPLLVDALKDPAGNVRNNAMRALYVMASYASRTPDTGIHVPAEPFVDLLNSPFWTDRNKASLALMELSADRDPALLQTLASRALPSLVDMARWKNRSHAAPAVFLLGRVGGLTDAQIKADWARDDREAVIDAAKTRAAAK
jgi:hypothetical protein